MSKKYNIVSGPKLRPIFNNDNKPAKVLKSDVAFKFASRPVPKTIENLQPHGLVKFKNKYFAYGQSGGPTPYILSSTSINGPWIIAYQGQKSVSSAVASDNELFFYQNGDSDSNLYTTDGTTFSSLAANAAANRSHHYIDGLWIVIGYGTSTSTSIYTSTDNRTYTARTVPKSFGTNAFLFTSVIKFNDKIVVSYGANYGANIESVYTTDLTSGATWVASNQTSIPLNFSDVLGTGASTHSLVVVGAKLFRFVNTGGSYDDGALWYEYTLDGITWQGAKKVELGFSKVDRGLISNFSNLSLLRSSQLSINNINSVTIDNKGYVLVQFWHDISLADEYNFGHKIGGKADIGVLQLLEDGTISYLKVVSSDLVITVAGPATDNFFGNGQNHHSIASIISGINNELIVAGVGTTPQAPELINGIYAADMDAKELVLEYQ